MIRLFDVFFSLLGIILLSPVFIILIIAGYLDSRSPIFLQERMGKNKKPFRLYKFRSMHINTKSIATHLVNHSNVTKYGSVIRKAKLDEMPQLFNVLFGDMSFIGPRPNLFNQEELIIEREKLGVYDVLPGISGLSQIKRIDMSKPKLLSETDAKMINELNTINYFKYIIQTILGNGFGDRVVK